MKKMKPIIEKKKKKKLIVVSEISKIIIVIAKKNVIGMKWVKLQYHFVNIMVFVFYSNFSHKIERIK